jgi:hypothetical protein
MKQVITLCLLVLISILMYKINNFSNNVNSSKINKVNSDIMNSYVEDVSVNDEINNILENEVVENVENDTNVNIIENEIKNETEETISVRISDVAECKDCTKDVLANISMKYIIDLLNPADLIDIKQMLNNPSNKITNKELFKLLDVDIDFFMGSLNITMTFKDMRLKKIIDSKQLRSDAIGKSIYDRLQQVRALKKLNLNLEHNTINLIWENGYDKYLNPYQRIIHDDNSNEIKNVTKAPKEGNTEFEPNRLLNTGMY